MKIEPKNGAAVNAPPNTQASTTAQAAPTTARDRAIAKLQTSAPKQETPVLNPNQVSPEELGAIKAPESVQAVEKSEQSNNTDSSQPKKPPTSEVTDSKTTNALSSQYAVLARKEKALRLKAQELKAREDGYKAQEDAQRAKEAEYQQKFISRDKLAQDPVSILNELGITYDQLTSLVLNSPKPEDQAQRVELQKLQDDIKTIKQAQEDAKNAYSEHQKTQYSQALNQIKNETKALVQNDANFETIKATNSIGDVVELIEKTFHKDGILLTVEEAAQAVEEELVERALKLSKLQKIQSRLNPAAQQQVQKPQVNQNSQQQTATTLTNAQSASRPMSVRERAIAAFKGQLK